MKITPKKYAEGLLAACVGKSEGEVKEVVARLAEIMKANNDLNKIDLVLKYFNKAWNAKEGTVVVDVTTANEIDKGLAKDLDAFILKLLNAEKIKVRTKVDKGILGGLVIKQGDTVYDGSLKSRLYSLKERLSK